MKRVLFGALLAVAFTGMQSCDNSNKVKVNGEKVELTDGVYAKLATSMGDILVQLETELAPMTSANFILLAEGKMPYVSDDFKEKKFFDGLTFHRVIPDFMIQGGDPTGTGNGTPGYEFPNEVNENLKHMKGVISMANSGPNTNGSQFFITVADANFLDGAYSVFGKVLHGQEVADSISGVDRSEGNDKPNVDVVINKVDIIRVGKGKDFNALEAFDNGKLKFEEDQRIKNEEVAAAAAAQAENIKTNYPDALTTDSGLMYIIRKSGNGKKPANGDTVLVNYEGYFADGKLFDTNIKSVAEANNQYNEQRPYEPMKTPYGPDAPMIPGFKEGLNMLKVGDKATLIIPPYLAYGEQGAGGVIPPNAWLIFELEITGIKK